MRKLPFLKADDNAYLFGVKGLIDGKDCFLLHALSKFVYLRILLKIWIKHVCRLFCRQSNTGRVKHTLSQEDVCIYLILHIMGRVKFTAKYLRVTKLAPASSNEDVISMTLKYFFNSIYLVEVLTVS